MKRSMYTGEPEISGEGSRLENLNHLEKFRLETSIAGKTPENLNTSKKQRLDSNDVTHDCENGCSGEGSGSETENMDFITKIRLGTSIAGVSPENPNSSEAGLEDGSEDGFAKLDENLLYEILKHADARTLAVASCVNKIWHRTAEDERLWELICTRHYANIKCGAERLRSVVLALGGFRRLHALYLPKTNSSSARVAETPLSMMPQAKGNKRWGKDEVHLSLSLLSIRYYEKMNFANRNSKMQVETRLAKIEHKEIQSCCD